MEIEKKEYSEIEKNKIGKAKFYFYEKIKTHVLLIPKPFFKNGFFTSELQESNSGLAYFWFLEDNEVEPKRLFLREIYDIDEYQEKEK